MSDAPDNSVLAYQSKADTTRDRRVASMVRALKWVMWGCFGLGALLAGLSFSPLAGAGELQVSAVSVPLGCGALYLIIAIRRRRSRPLFIGSAMFLLCWCAFTTLLVMALASIRREDVGGQILLALGLFAVIMLPIDVGLLAIAWGLFRLGMALRGERSSP